MSIHSCGLSRHESGGDVKPLGHGGSLKPLAVTVRQACEAIGVGRSALYELIKAGRVKTIKIGRRRLLIYASLEALVEAEAA